MNYDHGKIESKWQKIWGRKPLFRPIDFDKKKKKYYALVEFPYPSGTGLHLGHAFTNIILDIFARQKRMSGFNVLYPMGWDSFGLPTENYAIKTGVHPAVVTKNNTSLFKKQNIKLGMSFDWEREIDTSCPDYYRWTQWIFIQLFKHGLAYKAETPVGWCPSCKIILANEEIVNGRCERCGAKAQYRRQSQWLLRITKYADRLVDELDLVDYPDYVKASQRNWIGRSEGAEIKFQISNLKALVSVFTTRPDTLSGATFMVLAPEHSLVAKLTMPAQKKALSKYIKESQKKSELERTELAKEKTGVFTGSYTINPLTSEKIPIWVSDFVVLSYGTGAIMAVPSHDQRDFEFAKKYHLKIKKFTPDKKIIFWLEKKGIGKRAVNYHLRDWIFSRQHYWGEPIPMVNCPKCALRHGSGQGWQPVPEDQLPVKLPAVEKYQPTDTGESPLANIKNWVKTACPKCGGPARRETDTMPNWAGSSWYYLRYCDPANNKLFADSRKLKYWLPVDLYLGGAEHTTLHLLYSRFWHKFLNDIGVAPGKEPYAARRQHGIILGEDGFRMSKSKGNVINPDEVIKKFGSDTLRCYLMFMGPYDSTMPWNTKGVEGVWRFLNRVWRIYQQKFAGKKASDALVTELQQLIKKVTEDIKSLKHNTAIAAMMEFLNSWSREGSLSKKDAEIFLKLLAPFAPHIAEELWTEVLKNKFSVHQQPWPKYDPKLVEEKMITIIIQVNGKMRGEISIKYQEASIKDKIEKMARTHPNVNKYLAGKKIKKTIFVSGKLINFVID